MHGKHQLITLLLTVFSCFSATAQSRVCPENMDFEKGNLANWICNTGEVDLDNYGVNYVNWWMTGLVPGQHTIVSNGVDPYGLFPQNNPATGGLYSVRIGDNKYTSQSQAHRVTYTYTIPANSTNFSLTYYYAMVMLNSATVEHSFQERPRFQAKIVDVTTYKEIECGSMDLAPGSDRPGFELSPVNSDVIYKDWTAVNVNLSKYAGKTIRLEFSASECTTDSSRKVPHKGHWAYAYVDINPVCSNTALTGTVICQGDTSVTIKAPDGYQYYFWYADQTFTNQISQAQSLYLYPLPQVGHIYPVVMLGSGGFTCRDTFYAKITAAPKPVSDAGPDRLTCSKQPIQLGTNPLPDHEYAWTPARFLTDSTLSNPYTLISVIQPQEFIVRTRNTETGCYSYDTTLVTPIVMDTASQAVGKTIYCTGETVDVSMSVTHPPAAIQWYNGQTPIPGATTPFLHTATAGVYWARMVSAAGCIDSTREYNVHVGGIPQVDFYADHDTQCVKVDYTITNATTVTPAEPLNYSWQFSDGSVSQEVNPVKSFTAPGIYTIRLAVTSASNCNNSLEKSVTIMPNLQADFTWDSICLRRPTLFRNLSQENGTPQATYHWDFGNGAMSSLKDPQLVSYNAANMYQVKLTGTAVGCEKAPQTVIKTVQANAPVAGIRYANKGVVMGLPGRLSARTNIGNEFEWQPRLYLDSYNVPRPMITTSQAIQYLIRITDVHTCVTTDTLKVIAMKNAGTYLPNAFTPNNDGINDKLIPFMAGIKSLEKFSIYNRNGNLVFSTAREGNGWDGQYNGAIAPAGVYVWMLECTLEDNRRIVEKGVVTLIR